MRIGCETAILNLSAIAQVAELFVRLCHHSFGLIEITLIFISTMGFHIGSNCIHAFHNILKGSRRLLDFLFMQVFINLCYCEKVGNPVPTSDAFRRGTQWEIPYTLGTPSKEKDKGLISSQQQFYHLATCG